MIIKKDSKKVAAFELENNNASVKNITLSQALHHILFVPPEKNPIKSFDHKGRSNTLLNVRK